MFVVGLATRALDTRSPFPSVTTDEVACAHISSVTTSVELTASDDDDDDDGERSLSSLSSFERSRCDSKISYSRCVMADVNAARAHISNASTSVRHKDEWRTLAPSDAVTRLARSGVCLPGAHANAREEGSVTFVVL